ncbi:Gluconate transport-inducing protein [Coemansia erecta]|nr:Gluconate transport-inducing protein [Coemansia sp. RSA 2618]KAJ2825582.1 Gluconate transport-inducing protein [Coemansia erecta]
MTETYHGFIDSAYDALLIFEACCHGLLPRVPRRFTDRERQTIRSGAVYVWDEEETGMRRWTDGRTWSPSRVHGCFLIYYELEGRRHQFVNRNSGARSGSARGSPHEAKEKSPLHVTYDPCPPNVMQKEQGLIKKALSLCTNDKRKVHLVCYYSREDVENGCLMSPTNDPRFSGIQVYEDRYPEIGNGSGRFDRYGGGRSRSLASSRQWRQISDSSGHQPAYARPRPFRTEVYKYPSYGPYPGPVRHVNVAAAPMPAPPPYTVMQPPDEHTQYPGQPVWQHSEPPRMYTTPYAAGPRRSSHVPVTDLAVQTSEIYAPGVSARIPPENSQLPHSPSAIRLPSIENLSAGATQKMPHAINGETRMSSEDVRQLASLRMSLHH